MDWFTTADLAALSPLIALTIGAFAVLLTDASSKSARGNHALPFIALGAVGIAALATAGAWGAQRDAANHALALGPYTSFVSLLILAAAAIALLYSIDYAQRLGFGVGEYFGLLLFATAGMLYLVAASDLVSLFIAFELMSLSIYALVGVSRGDTLSGEGAMKYFVLGSFSSAFLLYGLSLLYGASGSIYLVDIRGVLAAAPPNGITLAAIGLIMVGFAFKVGAVPFHAWVPDAYQGAPASVTGFMAVAVKAAAFAVFIRILHAVGFLGAEHAWGRIGTDILWGLAVATMIVGNFAAIAQTSIQRMLAYSGIAHSGYVLVGLVAATQDPTGAAGAGVLYYLVGYASMTIGAFAVLTLLARDGRTVDDIADLGGLAYERPAAALAMTLFMVSLIGIPPTAGFMGKLWIFRAAIQAGFAQLVVIAVVTTAISVYYYLRVIVVMYMSEPATAPASTAASTPGGAAFGGSFAIALAAAATLLIGIFPEAMLGHATRSIGSLLGR